jgi:hypothetical protein
MNLWKGEDTHIGKRKLKITIFGDLALKEGLDFS